MNPRNQHIRLLYGCLYTLQRIVKASYPRKYDGSEFDIASQTWIAFFLHVKVKSIVVYANESNQITLIIQHDKNFEFRASYPF